MGEISDAYGISHDHLRKVIHSLGKLDYIQTYRGKSGGFELKMAPCDINLGKVIEATEPRRAVIDCTTQPCILADACSLQAVLAKAEAAFYDKLKEYHLSDVLKSKRIAQILFQQI